MTIPRFASVCVFVYAVCAALFAAPPAPPRIALVVDATQAPRKIFHAQLTIAATPGTVTLYYPKWIPGEHSPSGPILDAAGLQFTGNGQILKWRRALDDGWTINVEVPPGVNEVHASLDFISETQSDQGAYSSGQSATEKLAVISWNQLLLYPKGWTADQITFTAALRVPAGWKFGTPLPVASQNGDEIHFNPASLYTLVDSPVLIGEFLKAVPLNKEQTPSRRTRRGRGQRVCAGTAVRGLGPLQQRREASHDFVRFDPLSRLPFSVHLKRSRSAFRAGASRIQRQSRGRANAG